MTLTNGRRLRLNNREKLLYAAFLAVVVGGTIFAVLFVFTFSLFSLSGSPALLPLSLLFLFLLLTGVSGMEAFAWVLSESSNASRLRRKLGSFFERK